MKNKSKKFKKKMKDSWEEKARINAYHWVDSSKVKWDKNEYYKRGMMVAKKFGVDFLLSKGYAYSDFKKMTALDIGCGTGRLSKGFAKYFQSVKGIDISDEMIRKAKTDNPILNNIDFIVSNGIDMKIFPENYFDFAFSFIVFQHIPNRKVVIKYINEIYRVLKPGCYMKIQVRGYPGKLPTKLPHWRYIGFNSFYLALSRKKGLFFPVFRKYNSLLGAFFKPKEIRAFTEQAGFKEVEVNYGNKDYRYLWISGKK